MSQQVLRSAAAPLSQARHILLQGIPRTATPADLSRLLKRYNVQGIEDVGVYYDRGHPRTNALITLVRPNFTRDNLRELEKASFCGVPLRSTPIEEEQLKNYINLDKGSGIHASLPDVQRGKTVLVWGLPYNTTREQVAPLFEGFEMKTKVEKVKRGNRSGPISRFMMSMTSESEAHRFVRKMHLMDVSLDDTGALHTIHAHVMY
ncbi:hypothetical protein Moror_6474 [Moniliophthora roreri MCA 2997]|uniref:RRM domain-containing protein n=1 Tax=Moniliophthora roreri (strain MCA 2997) TaxID=1381753 RepID=V2XVJ6_MONRO|nr:hypothetical protein Moror_6474 [Moniliophthora roreri MCA 2997]KAI3610462.1 hypothetical protein WG66_007053 [Moniliophthora roreri]